MFKKLRGRWTRHTYFAGISAYVDGMSGEGFMAKRLGFKTRLVIHLVADPIMSVAKPAICSVAHHKWTDRDPGYAAAGPMSDVMCERCGRPR